ncbi:MAG TPA: Bax inhibitor-1/YccA family protein [Novosphingobium sp.]|nr:Bax inhibitor-1/YccA family protein [Novosphingobium sp.]
MAIWNDPQPSQTGLGAASWMNAPYGAAARDAGLRAYMLRIYNFMASGVLVSGIVAIAMASLLEQHNPLAMALLFSPLRWLVILAPFAFILAMSFGFMRMQNSTLQALFWAFCAVMGVSLSTVLLVYTGSSVAATFFATTGAFAGLSLVGYTTKRNLSAMGTFLTMGLFGLIIAMLINAFFPSPGLSMGISLIGVLIFAGLTAWDTQRLKGMYLQVAGTPYAEKAAIMGALTLYLDFVNMFMFLLRFMGDQRR